MISGGLSGGSSTKKADGFQIVELFKGPYAWLKDQLDILIRQYIVLEASLEVDEEGLNEEEVFAKEDDIGEKIVQGAKSCDKQSYEKIGRCAGLVERAYKAAGIDLIDLASELGLGRPSYVPNLYALTNRLNINQSVRNTNDPLVGDIIFWNYTYSRENDCLLGNDLQPTHVGIVEKVDIDNQGTITFLHATPSKGFLIKDLNKMNILSPSNSSLNTQLRRDPQAGCPSDASSFGSRAGELFAGYGTIRNIPSQ